MLQRRMQPSYGGLYRSRAAGTDKERPHKSRHGSSQNRAIQYPRPSALPTREDRTGKKKETDERSYPGSPEEL